MRVMGLDYGDKTIGVAVGDPDNRIALGVETLRRAQAEALRESIKKLRLLINQYSVTNIVLGYPKNMDNTESDRCEKTLQFKEKLERTFQQVDVALWDERLSTMAVERVRAEGRSQKAVDEMAAVYILQGYLDYLRKEQKEQTMPNDMNDLFEWNEDDGNAITLFDDDGNESNFNVLASRKYEGGLYLLVAEALEDGEDAETDGGENEDAEEVAEVLHFKCITDGDEEMTFELVDEDHEDFKLVMELFKDDYEALGIDTGE